MTPLTQGVCPTRLLLHVLMMGWLVCLVGCERQPARDVHSGATDSNTVAVIGQAVITVDALRSQLQQRFPEPRTRELSLEQKQTVLESLIRAEALYARARATGFEQSAEMQAQIKKLVVPRFLENQFQSRAASAEVTDETVDAWYQANQERFAQPASARGAILLIAVPANASTEKRTEARRHAEALWNEARNPAAQTDFSKLVAQFSDEQSSRYRGGDIGWQSANSTSLAPAVRDALLALENEAEVAPLVETDRGFYIVKLLERRAARQQPLAQAQKVIRRELSRESAQQSEREFYDRMKQGVNIRINRELLESITLPVQRATPPALPGVRQASSRVRPAGYDAAHAHRP